MKKTATYGLNQWEATDRIMREDFNADNAKVEEALGANAAAVAALAAVSGNCKIVYGSYTGTGTYGSANPNVLTFDHKPLLVFVQTTERPGQAYQDIHLRMVRGSNWSIGYNSDSDWTQIVTWGEKSVQWVSYRYQQAWQQFNVSGTVYHYVALLAADE